MNTSTNIGVWGYVFFAGYMIMIAVLAWMGHKKTKDMKSFALSTNIPTIMLALVFAASFSSSGTFIGLSGNVYHVGVSGLWFSMCQWPGALFGMALIAKGYRRMSGKFNSLDISSWLGERYKSKNYSRFIAIVCFLMIFQVAAQLAGCAIVAQTLFGVDYQIGVIISMLVVMTYITLGGSYAHYYTNVGQGALMTVLSLLIFIAVWFMFPNTMESIPAQLGAINPSYTEFFNDIMADYTSPGVVFLGLFTIHIFWGCNPHLINKLQAIKTEKELRKFILLSGVFVFIFGLACQSGMAARLMDTSGVIKHPDDAITYFIANSFPRIVGGLSSLVIWAAAMSTTDGILVFLSTIVGNTLYMDMYAARKIKAGEMSREKAEKNAFRWMTVATPLICFTALAFAWSKPAFMTTMIWLGSCGVLGATFGPIVCGVYMKRATQAGAWCGSVVGVLLFMTLYLGGIVPSIYVCGSIGCITSFVLTYAVSLFTKPLDEEFVSSLFKRKVVGVAPANK